MQSDPSFFFTIMIGDANGEFDYQMTLRLSISSISFIRFSLHGIWQRIRPIPDWIIFSKLYLFDYISFTWNIKKKTLCDLTRCSSSLFVEF